MIRLSTIAQHCKEWIILELSMIHVSSIGKYSISLVVEEKLLEGGSRDFSNNDGDNLPLQMIESVADMILILSIKYPSKSEGISFGRGLSL